GQFNTTVSIALILCIALNKTFDVLFYFELLYVGDGDSYFVVQFSRHDFLFFVSQGSSPGTTSCFSCRRAVLPARLFAFRVARQFSRHDFLFFVSQDSSLGTASCFSCRRTVLMSQYLNYY